MHNLQFSAARIAFVALTILATTAVGSANPVTYVLDFTGGSTTPTGGFTYDTATGVFTDVHVSDDANFFDLTFVANFPGGDSLIGPCKPDDTSASLFLGLTTPGCQVNWVYTDTGDSARFEIDVAAQPGQFGTDLVAFADLDHPLNPTSGFDTGRVIAIATPEPSSWSASLIGALALLAMKSVQRRRKRRAGWSC